jgi:hypothetical protein
MSIAGDFSVAIFGLLLEYFGYVAVRMDNRNL